MDDKLREEMAQLEAELNDLAYRQGQIKDDIASKQRRWSVIRAHFDRQQTGSQDTQARINYIHRQAELRAERIQRSRDALKGIDPQLLNSQAPLDAVRRRSGR